MKNSTTTKIKAHLTSTAKAEYKTDEYRYFPTIEAAIAKADEYLNVTPVEAITYDAATGAYLSHEVIG